VTRTKIIEMAFRVWGRNFYQKTSLSQLASKLGVSKPALYRHFNNKKDLTDSMTEYYFDDLAASIKGDLEKALHTENTDEGIFIIIQSITGYFAKNVYALIFSLINIYDRNLDGHSISEQIKNRGADLKTLHLVIDKKYNSNPVILQLILASLTFYMSYFHKKNDSLKKNPSEEKIQNVITEIYKIIEYGLGFTFDTCELDFESLEKQVEGTMQETEAEPLFKAVAEAVAEAGPWDASMDMVARRMGLSKSSLYGHFKNRKDMLRRLFISEFKRIIEFARMGISLSANSAEQLYLGIYSIALYLRSRPEVLIAIGWIRTRKLDLGKPESQMEIFRLFEDVEISVLHNASDEDKQAASHWILFLLINTLTRGSGIDFMDDGNLSGNTADEISSGSGNNTGLRVLYKFITLGLGGFLK
jgi:AcrR family transcriptional regulator